MKDGLRVWSSVWHLECESGLTPGILGQARGTAYILLDQEMAYETDALILVTYNKKEKHIRHVLPLRRTNVRETQVAQVRRFCAK